MKMDKLLHHYEQELGRLRRATRRYAEIHASTAEALELGPDASTDPEVERLLQSIALLNAGMQQLIENGRGEFHRALLRTLQPNAIRAVPACGIAKIDTSSARPNGIGTVNRLPRGTILNAGTRKFATTYEACVGPVAIAEARFDATLDLPAALRLPYEARSSLVMTLETTHASASFDRPPLTKLRIFVDGEPELRVALFDAILMDCLCVCFNAGSSWQLLPESPFAAVGTGHEESLLPYSAGPQSPRMMKEYFHLPQKFDFVDLDLESISALCTPGCQRISFHIVLPSYRQHLRKTGLANFHLGCTPVINLFAQAAMPLRLDGRSEPYPVVPNQPGCEIYSIDRVTILARSNDEILPPFHGTEHTMPGPYWQLVEQEGLALRFIDREQRPIELNSGMVAVQLTCTSSDIACSQTTLTTERSVCGFPIQLLHGIAASRDHCEASPLCEGLLAEEITLTALRKLLQLHGCKNAEWLKDLAAKPSTAWLQHPMGRIHMHGTEFTVTIDDSSPQESSICVFAEILTYALADKLRANRYAQVRIADGKGRVLHVTGPRIGTRALV